MCTVMSVVMRLVVNSRALMYWCSLAVSRKSVERAVTLSSLVAIGEYLQGPIHLLNVGL